MTTPEDGRLVEAYLQFELAAGLGALRSTMQATVDAAEATVAELLAKLDADED